MTRGSEIKAFESDLKAVDRKYNLRLFVLLGIMLPLSFLYERSSFKTGVLDATLIVILGGAILSLVIGIAKAKNGVAVRHGLVCPHCHSVPKAFFAVSVMRSGICPKCKQEMNTQPRQPG
jgi:hypothetical protein